MLWSRVIVRCVGQSSAIFSNGLRAPISTSASVFSSDKSAKVDPKLKDGKPIVDAKDVKMRQSEKIDTWQYVFRIVPQP